MTETTTIAAISTAQAPGGIGLIRISGPQAQEIADKVGYKTASAVHKRIAKIADAYEDYVTAEYQKYMDK